VSAVMEGDSYGHGETDFPVRRDPSGFPYVSDGFLGFRPAGRTSVLRMHSAQKWL
jgi:hypothetical protein